MKPQAWWTWLGHDARRRLLRLAALALFVAVGVGGVLSAVDGARRSASAIDRGLVAVAPADGIAVPNTPGFDWGPVSELDVVADLVEFPVLYFMVTGFDEEFGGFPPGSPTAGTEWERPVVVEGRLADQSRIDEVTISPATRELGVQVGDRLTIELSSMSDVMMGRPDPARRDVEVTVVGVSKMSFFSWDVQPTHAFFLAHEDLIVGDLGYVNALVRLNGGPAALPEFERKLAEVAGQPVEVAWMTEWIAGARSAVALETASLAVLAAAGLAAMILLVGQALARLATANPDELAVFGQLGMGRRATAVTIVSAPAAAVLVGLIGAPAVSFALSDRYPIGQARELEPAPGRQLDWVAVALTVGVAATALGVALAIAASRATRPLPQVADHTESTLDQAISSVPASVPATLGIRLALARRPGTGSGRAIVWLTATGAAAIAAAVTFSAGLADAIDDAALFGEVFDAGVPMYGGSYDVSAYDAIGADGLAHLTNAIAPLNGQPVSLVSADVLSGSFEPTARRGRAPTDATEIGVSTETLAVLGVEIGDVVDVGGSPVTVVGEVFTPSVGHTAYTSGAVVTADLMYHLVTNGAASVKTELLAIDLPPGTDVHAAIDALDEPARSITQPMPTNERQEALHATRALPWVLAGFVAVMTAGSVIHGLVVTERQRRHEVAVLQVLGLTRRQARDTVLYHAAVAVGAGCVIGVPIGFVLGRTVWRVVAESLPAFHRPPDAWRDVLLVAFGVLAVGLIAAAWPARQTAQAEPALVLRSE